MTTEIPKYECNNPTCSLGAVGRPGHFTGGITPQALNVLTGRPVEDFTADNEGEEWGEGVCPNCGKAGTLVPDEPHVVTDNVDPHQDLHDEVAARVADPSDPLDADGAQDAVLQLIAAGDPTPEPTPETKDEEEDVDA